MPKSPDCPRCKNQHVIPDAETWNEFFKHALARWRAAHPREKQKKKRAGRRIDENSELARAVRDRVSAELEKRSTLGPRSLPASVQKRLARDIWDQFPEIRDERAIQRRVTLELSDRKPLRELTDQDLAFRKARRPTDIHKLEQFMSRLRERVLGPMAGVIAAKKAGRPVPAAEINRLAAMIEAETTRLRAAKANK